MEQRKDENSSPKDLNQWVVWLYEEINGKRAKVPYSPLDARRASATDPATWATYEQAKTVAKGGSYDGIGFVFTERDPYCGVDLDDCVDPETAELAGWADEIVEELDSYTELSPSGTGIHVIVAGKLPAGRRRKGQLEMYDHGRYFTVTGRGLRDMRVEERQAELEALHRRVFGERMATAGTARLEDVEHSGLTDQEVIAKAMTAANGDKFARLWTGDWHSLGYDSASEADVALCALLSFWTGPEPVKIDGLFRKSGMYRDKWNRTSYREQTIGRALEGTNFYTPDDGAVLRRTGHESDENSRWRVSKPAVVAFPVDSLPTQCRRLVEEGAKAVGCAPELIALPMFGVLAAGIGASRVVAVKRSWREGAMLFLAVVAPPGAKKTPAAKLAVSPLWRHQAELRREYTRKVAGYEQDLLDWEAAKKLAVQEGESHPPPPCKPTLRRTVVDDTTVEALVSVLEDNARGVLVHKDELAGWVRSMDQYKGGKGSDRQHWLGLWSGSTVIVDRRNRGGLPVILETPFVSVCGGIQPGMFGELGQNREDGMLERLLFAYPVPEHVPFSYDEVSPAAEEAYRELYRRLSAFEMAEDEGGDHEPHVVYLTPEAKALFAELAYGLSGEVHQLGFPSRLRGSWSKFEAYLARLSLILAMCRVAEGGELEQVELRDVQAAARFVEYFKAHAHRVYAELQAPSPEESLATALRDLLEMTGERWEGSASELHAALASRGTSDLPENADNLTKKVLDIASSAHNLHARRGYRGKGRVLRLTLKAGVGGVGVTSSGGSITDTTDAEYDDVKEF